MVGKDLRAKLTLLCGLGGRGKEFDGRTGYVVCVPTSLSLLMVPVGLEGPGRDKIHASIMASIVPSPNIEIPTRVCLIKLHSASQ